MLSKFFKILKLGIKLRQNQRKANSAFAGFSFAFLSFVLSSIIFFIEVATIPLKLLELIFNGIIFTSKTIKKMNNTTNPEYY